MQYPYILTEKTFTVFIDGDSYQVERTNPNWNKIKEEVNKVVVDRDELIRLVTPISAVEDAVADIQEVTVRNGAVYYGEERIHDQLAKRMLDIMGEGIELDPWVKFTQNIFANPAVFARQELYDFLEKSDLPITSDGHFLAYKMVRDDYKDIYSGTFDNSVGQVVTMPRPNVDDVRTRTCSSGLHFCSKGYLGSYGGAGHRVMIVDINPKDVVSIPVDYNFAKGRCCEYKVVGEMPVELAPEYRWSAVEDYYDDEDWDEQDSSYYDNRY